MLILGGLYLSINENFRTLESHREAKLRKLMFVSSSVLRNP